MDTIYKKCDACSCPILPRTYSRNRGLCKICRLREEAKLRPPRQYPPERFDPIDTDDEYRWLIEKVNEEALNAALEEYNATFPGHNLTRDDHGMGFCHSVWRHKKRILKDSYGIEWSSPSELNPHIWYD
jgi:hypothetical protein